MIELEFGLVAATIVGTHDEHLLDAGPEEQANNAVGALMGFHKHFPLKVVAGRIVSLAGFGRVPVYFESADDQYLLLSDVAKALDVPQWKACDWARQEYLECVSDQRVKDEERGDGLLGYELLRLYLDLRFWFYGEFEDGGHDFGDWLIAYDRVPAFILQSPHKREFMDRISGEGAW